MTEVPFQANFVVVYDLFHLRGCGSLSLKLRYSAEFFLKKKTFLRAGSKKIVFVFANVLCLRVNLHVILKMRGLFITRFLWKNNQYTSNVKGPDTIGDFCNFLLR